MDFYDDLLLNFYYKSLNISILVSKRPVLTHFLMYTLIKTNNKTYPKYKNKILPMTKSTATYALQ